MVEVYDKYSQNRKYNDQRNDNYNLIKVSCKTWNVEWNGTWNGIERGMECGMEHGMERGIEWQVSVERSIWISSG